MRIPILQEFGATHASMQADIDALRKRKDSLQAILERLLAASDTLERSAKRLVEAQELRAALLSNIEEILSALEL